MAWGIWENQRLICEFPVFSANFTHEENQVPECTLLLPVSVLETLSKDICIGWVESGKLKALGRVTRTTIQNDTATLTIACGDKEALERESETLQMSEEERLFGDPYDPDPLQTLHQRLESYPKIWILDPVSHEGHWIDLTGEGIPHVISDALSYTYEELYPPFENVTVEIIADWIQSAEGEINVTPALHKVCPRLETLTPKALESSWPKVGQRIGSHRQNSGYTVVESTLTPIQTSSVIVHDQAGIYRFKHVTYTSKLRVHWRYRQRRREIFSLTLHSGVPSQRRKIIRYPLYGVSPESIEATFFGTLLGQKALQVAIQRADAYRRRSYRGTRLEMAIPWRNDIKVGDRVHFQKYTGVVRSIKGDFTPTSEMMTLYLVIGEAPPQELPSSFFTQSFNPLNDSHWISQITVHFDAKEQERVLQDEHSLTPTHLHITLKDLRTTHMAEQRFTWSNDFENAIL